MNGSVIAIVCALLLVPRPARAGELAQTVDVDPGGTLHLDVGVGIIPAVMWIHLAFAALFVAVTDGTDAIADGVSGAAARDARARPPRSRRGAASPG